MLIKRRISSLHWTISCSIFSLSYNGVCYVALKLSVDDAIVSLKGSHGDGKKHFFGRDYIVKVFPLLRCQLNLMVTEVMLLFKLACHLILRFCCPFKLSLNQILRLTQILYHLLKLSPWRSTKLVLNNRL